MWTSFIGFMGVGKSTAARRLAALSRRPLAELDAVIVAEAGMDIPAIFAAESERGFRARELAALRALDPDRDLVVSTGGGVIETPAAVELLRDRGLVIWLDCSWGVVWRRLRDTAAQRPLVASLGEEGLHRLFLGRRLGYAAAADYRLRTDRLDPDALMRTMVSILADTGAQRETAP